MQENDRTIPQNRQIIMAYIVVFLGASFYLYEFFLRIMPTVITNELMQAFSASTGQLGQLIGCFFYTYALMQLPAGLLCDRFGARKCLTAAIATCAIATLAFQATDHFIMAAITRLAIGAASAFAFVGPLALSNRWFPADKQALITGCVQIMGCIGAIFAGKPIRLMVQYIGWRTSLYYASVLGLILTGLFYLILRDSPEQEQTHIQNQATSDCLQVLKNVAQLHVNWYIGVAAFASWAAVAIFAESWGVPFLSLIQGQSEDQSAQQLMWVWIAMAIASPAAGWLSNHMQERIRPVMYLLGMGLVASLILIIGQPSHPWIVNLMLATIGISSAAQPITFGLINDVNRQANMATAIALNNMILVCSTGILTPISGYILEYFAPSTGMMPQTIAPYQAAFMIVPISIGFCMLIFYNLVPETHCQSQHNPAQATEEDQGILPSGSAA